MMEEMCDGIVISINKCPVINLQVTRSLWLTKGILAFIYLSISALDVYFQCLFSGIAYLIMTGQHIFLPSHLMVPIYLCTIQLILMGRVADSINKCPLCGENKECL